MAPQIPSTYPFTSITTPYFIVNILNVLPKLYRFNYHHQILFHPVGTGLLYYDESEVYSIQLIKLNLF